MTALIALLAMTGCSDGKLGKFRYRLSFAVEIEGVVKSASSIVEVRYWGNPKGGPSPSAVTVFSEWKGIAPVIDLGERGWLVAALGGNIALLERLKGPNPPKCPEKSDAASLPLVFGKTPLELEKMNGLKADLPPHRLPSFFWVPAGVSYLAAQPSCAEDFSRVIGAKVVLRSVTIEIANDAPLLTLQPFQAAWLDEIRAEQGERVSSGTEFKIIRQRQLESETIKQRP